MRYKIVHQTAYTYSINVSVAHHVAHLTPRELPWQRCLSHELKFEPNATTKAGRLDYFGNETSIFCVSGVHRSLKVTAISRVECSPRPSPGATTTWERVRDAVAFGTGIDEIEAQQFIYPSQFVPRLPALAAYAGESFKPGRALLECVVELTHRIYGDFRFDARATTIATPLEHVVKDRRGVCQDFAHLHIGCLRAFGVPARYVSGYLETLPPPGKPKMVGADASHAWVQVFIPPEGWVDVDPTNDVLPSERHITLAWGRDFEDVSPIRGVIVGGGKHTLAVGVDVGPEIN